jgi:hypothetical protein
MLIDFGGREGFTSKFILVILKRLNTRWNIDTHKSTHEFSGLLDYLDYQSDPGFEIPTGASRGTRG